MPASAGHAPRLAGKTVVILNSGGTKKRFALEAARRSGCRIVLVNRTEDVPSKYYDHFVAADTYDHREVVDRLAAFREENRDVRLDGAVTFWEDDVPVLARVCETFDLPGNSLKAAVNTRNKFEMRKRFRETGLGNPAFAAVKSRRDLEKAVRAVGFPAVMKPAWGADSEFVVLVRDEEEARTTFDYLVKNCTEEFNPIFRYNGGTFLFEEYLDGIELSVECFAQYGIPHVVGIHEKQPITPPYFIEYGDIAPPRITPDVTAAVEKLAESALIALGVRNSLAHVELKMTPDGPKLVEAASRMGGDDVYANVKHVWGEDLVKLALEIACGVKADYKKREPKGCVICRYFIPPASGVVTTVTGVGRTKKQKGVLDVVVSKSVGDAVLVPPAGFDNMGWIVAAGRTYQEAQSALDEATRSVEIGVMPFAKGSALSRTVRKDALGSASSVRRQVYRAARFERIRTIDPADLRDLHLGVLTDSAAAPPEAAAAEGAGPLVTALGERGFTVTTFDMAESPFPFGRLEQAGPDLVVNACGSRPGVADRAAHAASLLDVLQVPYAGSGLSGTALCADLITVKKLLDYHDVPTPGWDYACSTDDPVRDDLTYPLVVRPADCAGRPQEETAGRVEDGAALGRVLDRFLAGEGRPVVVEEFVAGEGFDACVFGNGESLRVLPVRQWSGPAARGARALKKSDKLHALIVGIAADVFNLFDCADYAEINFRVDKVGNPFVVGVRPHPRLGPSDTFALCAAADGLAYGDLLEEMVHTAVTRYRRTVRSFGPRA